MPLVDTLRAMRGVMLYADEVPEDLSLRKKLLLDFSPDLSPAELEDLLKIPPNKLNIYTATIFSGEAKVLKNHFKITLAYLEKHWGEAFQEQFNLFYLVRDLQKFKAWEGNQSKALAKNFKVFIQEQIAQKFPASELISQIAELEYQNILVKKYPVIITKENLIDLTKLSKLEVGQLLEQQVILSPASFLAKFTYDLVQTYQYFYSNENTLPATCLSKTTYAICSRTLSGRPVWTEIPESVYLFFQSVESEFTLNSLAEQWCKSVDESQSEEVLFRDFFKFLSKQAQSLVLLLPRV